MNKKINDMETKTFSEADLPDAPPPDVVAYNELRSCADLYRMKFEGILNIQPEFQRDVVWKAPDQTRFIDSLIKQLPIPSMCFSLDYKTQKWQVIDGLQRMSTICKFLSGEQWKLSNLEDVDPKIAGVSSLKFHDAQSELNQYLKKVQNLSLPITVIRCDYSISTHMNYLFTIFHRLNTGGMRLNNQEIRNCIFAGSFNNMLKELCMLEEWKMLNKMKKGDRFKYQELILRMFAFSDGYSSYRGRLATFLNDYMDDHKNMPANEIASRKNIFTRVVSLIYREVFQGNPPLKLQLSIIEALLVGVTTNIEHLTTIPAQELRLRFDKLQRHEEFSEVKLQEGLSGKVRVQGRMNAACEIFSQ